MSDDDEHCQDRTILPPIKLPLPAIELRPKATTSIELIVDNTGKYCSHNQTVIDSRQRRVTCKTCDAPLDPFDTLLALAKESERYSGDLVSTKTEVRGAEARLRVLDRLEENTRARLKKLGIRTSKSHFDHLVEYVQKLNFGKREVTPEIVRSHIEGSFSYQDPAYRFRAAADAIDKGEVSAAIELASVVDELRAAIEAEDVKR